MLSLRFRSRRGVKCAGNKAPSSCVLEKAANPRRDSGEKSVFAESEERRARFDSGATRKRPAPSASLEGSREATGKANAICSISSETSNCLSSVEPLISAKNRKKTRKSSSASAPPTGLPVQDAAGLSDSSVLKQKDKVCARQEILNRIHANAASGNQCSKALKLRLQGGRFRSLNEFLYINSSERAVQEYQRNPQLFEAVRTLRSFQGGFVVFASGVGCTYVLLLRVRLSVFSTTRATRRKFANGR